MNDDDDDDDYHTAFNVQCVGGHKDEELQATDWVTLYWMFFSSVCSRAA